MKEQRKIAPHQWGKQWLAALVDPSKSTVWEQGEQYLEEGALQELTLTNQGILEAQVKDYGGRLYQQQLQVPAFSIPQVQAWRNALEQQPHWSSQLLNQQIPSTLFQVGEQLEASLWAPSLSMWNMACSCSNRQVPCRHLTTVLWAIQEQIEQDPWWLFRLRGVSTKDLLPTAPIENSLDTVEAFPSLEQQTVAPSHNASSTVAYDSQPLQQLDWSTIKNRWKDYMRLLDNQPLFDQGGLKKQLQQQLRKAIQCHKKQVLDRADYIHWHQQLQQTKDIALIMDKQHQLLNVFVIQEHGNQPLFAADQAMERCIGLLETVDLKELPLYPEAFIALHSIYRFALKLLYEQAYLPHLLVCPTGFLMQWLPAYTVDKTIQQLLVKFARHSPADLLLLDDNPLKKLRPQKQILSLCHLVGSFYLQQAKAWIPEWKDSQQKVAYCFFSGQPTPFEGSKEQSVPKSIRTWLQPFYLGQAQYAPVIKIVEVEEEGQERYFYSQIKVENRGNKAAPLIDLAKFLRQKDKKAYHLVVLQELQRLVQYYPDLGGMLEQEKPQRPHYTSAELEWLFFEVLPLLQLLNIAIVLPYSLQRLTKPRLGMSIATQEKPTKKKPSFVSLKNLLKVEWKVAVGEEMIEAVEFLKLMKQKSGLVRYKERYLYLDEAELIKILEQLEKPPPATANQLLQAALSQYGGAYPVEISAGVQTLLQALQKPLKVAAPQTLKATLRPYQQVGYAWMYKNAQLGLGSLIADDMGLGKTLQVIALLLKFKEEGHLEDQKALVVVPTSLLTNWRKEIQKFAPLLQARLYHGAKRQLDRAADVILTTYGVARMEMTRLNQLGWHCLIIDEAQAIKNVQAGQTTAIKALKANLKIAMSGTPVENRLAEYWSIMDFVNPNYLGTMGDFVENYSQPIEQDNDQQRLDAFRKVTAPFILRRLKSDKSIIQDLPDKIEQNYLANLQPVQAELYQKIVNDSLAELQLYKQEPKKRQGLLLKLMGGLKQICNHPYQYLQSGGSGPVYSGKSQLLMDLLTRIDRQQEKTLVFTQYRKMGRLMKEWIKVRFGKEPMYLHGGCSRAERDAMVEAFQTDKQERIFLLSLKAAGTGLNLTAANHVIHYDLWWNPAVEAQATDRAYRIGQQKNVQVYRFITQGTLEEKIDAMIQSKKDLADRTVTLGEQWLGDLSNEELEDLLRLG